MPRQLIEDFQVFQMVERGDSLKPRGGDRRSKNFAPVGKGRSSSAKIMATIVGCSCRKVEQVRRILKHGNIEIKDLVRSGQITINKAHTLVKKRVTQHSVAVAQR
jgi:hypothetical protein